MCVCVCVCVCVWLWFVCGEDWNVNVSVSHEKGLCRGSDAEVSGEGCLAMLWYPVRVAKRC